MKDRPYDIKAIDHKIRLLLQTAEELKQLGGGFPALDRNLVRILASIKMLKINISDAAEMGLID